MSTENIVYFYYTQTHIQANDQQTIWAHDLIYHLSAFIIHEQIETSKRGFFFPTNQLASDEKRKLCLWYIINKLLATDRKHVIIRAVDLFHYYSQLRNWRVRARDVCGWPNKWEEKGNLPATETRAKRRSTLCVDCVRSHTSFACLLYTNYFDDWIFAHKFMSWGKAWF